MEKTSLISVIIPTYKSSDTLDLCLRSAIEGQVSENQIIVVVDGFYDINKEVLEKYAKSIELDKFEGIQKPGSMYKADLPDEQIAKMLDYDKPFNQQLPNIQKAIKDALEIRKRQTGGYGLFDPLEKSSVEDLVKIIGEERLQQAGISGIKYLDEGSRGTNKGTRNFVVFPGEEKKVRILERK